MQGSHPASPPLLIHHYSFTITHSLLLIHYYSFTITHSLLLILTLHSNVSLIPAARLRQLDLTIYLHLVGKLRWPFLNEGCNAFAHGLRFEQSAEQLGLAFQTLVERSVKAFGDGG